MLHVLKVESFITDVAIIPMSNCCSHFRLDGNGVLLQIQLAIIVLHIIVGHDQRDISSTQVCVGDLLVVALLYFVHMLSHILSTSYVRYAYILLKEVLL